MIALPPRRYRLGHDYRDTGSVNNPADEFLGWINLSGSGMRNMGGIRPLRFVSLGEPTPAAIVLVTDERSAGSASNPWDDLVDIPHGRIVYWGDAKFDPKKTVDEFPGNRALRDAFNQVLDSQMALVPRSCILVSEPPVSFDSTACACSIDSNSPGSKTTEGLFGTTELT